MKINQYTLKRLKDEQMEICGLYCNYNNHSDYSSLSIKDGINNFPEGKYPAWNINKLCWQPEMHGLP